MVLSSVHPHARGEDVFVIDPIIQERGSPPRAWGRYERLTSLAAKHRFTPTRVGKMTPCRASSKRSPVHPHARGEDVKASIGIFLSCRFTPTRVGKIRQPPTWPEWCTVHPHARGEDKMERKTAMGYAGSPPRAWGRLRGKEAFFSAPRFTPTRVGKIARAAPMITNCWVHPHARGEDLSRWPANARAHGSPPRAWGRWGKAIGLRSRFRFTPTRVGKMRWSISTISATAVHPHARGEDL